ncbi:MAG: hypothetical protein JSU63_08225, partial [Phycisphaerales bacterium]
DRRSLSDSKTFFQIVKENWAELWHGRSVDEGSLYCPTCGADHRMALMKRHSRREYKSEEHPTNAPSNLINLTPHLFLASCTDCKTEFTLLIYAGPDGPSLAVFSNEYGGLSTPHTPDPVNYFLDQAHRAETVGATSAALAMYRSALEQVLFEQGYTRKMCGNKLRDLQRAIEAGQAPQWALEVETDFLDVLKQLGDHACHVGPAVQSSDSDNDSEPYDPNTEADTERQLLPAVRATFTHVLDTIYEREHKKQEQLATLRAGLPADRSPEPKP